MIDKIKLNMWHEGFGCEKQRVTIRPGTYEVVEIISDNLGDSIYIVVNGESTLLLEPIEISKHP